MIELCLIGSPQDGGSDLSGDGVIDVFDDIGLPCRNSSVSIY